HAEAEGRGEVVGGRQPVDPLLDLLRQGVVGVAHVRPERVATDLGHAQRAQHRTQRRVRLPRDVDLPDVLRPRVLLAAVEVHDLGDLAPIQERMHLQLAPVGGEVAVLARGEVVLVPEEQHLALEQRRHELGELLGRRVGEVDAGDLRADVGVHGADPDVRVPGRRVVGVRTGEAQAFGPELDLMFTDGDLHDSSPDQLYTNDYTPTVHTRIRCGYGTANDDRRRRGRQHARDRAPHRTRGGPEGGPPGRPRPGRRARTAG